MVGWKAGTVAVLVSLIPVLSQAASLDCAKLAAQRERLVCADPALAKADEALARAYEAALAPLSPAGGELLRRGQHSWRRFVDRVCEAPEAEPPARCLAREYTQRQSQLRRATVKLDGMVIGRVERFAAHRVADRYQFVKRDIAYPRIDAPRRAVARRWNAMIAEAARKDAGPEESADADVTIDCEIGLATPRLISAVLLVYRYGHGAAHGITRYHPVNWLPAEARQLRAGDIFDRAAAWQNAFAELVFAAMRQQGAERHVEYAVKDAAAPRPIVADPGRWVLGRDGLAVQFGEYEIGPYALGAPRIAVPWEALRPYLRRNPPFPIPPG